MSDVFSPFFSVLSEPGLRTALKLLVVVVFAVVGWRLITIAIHSIIRRLDLDRSVGHTLRRVAHIILASSVAVWTLSVTGVSISGLWTFLTTLLTLVAVGFIAVWSVLSNFICAMLLLIHKPFRIGDQVSFPGESISGTVSDFALTFTTVRHDDGTLFRVPNNQFFQKSFACRPAAESDKSVSLAQQLRADEAARM